MLTPSRRKRRQVSKFLPSFIILWICVLALFLGTRETRAEPPASPPHQTGGWSPPSLVMAPEYTVGDDRFLLLADSSGRLHVFFSYTALDQSGQPLPEYPYNTILYTYSYDGIVWSKPVDVFIPTAPKRWQGAGIDGAIDSLGNIHLVFRGNPTNGGVLKYAKAHASVAANPHSWQGPITGDWGMIVTKAALAVDRDDRLHLAYSSRPGDVYYRYSTDHGDTWSIDSRVSDIDPTHSAPDDVAIAVDVRGRIHVAWSENKLPGGYPPIGVFYAYSDDGGQTWSAPRQIGGQYATRMAIAVRAPNEVHLVWSTSLQDKGRYAAASYDGGTTWSPSELVARYGTGLSTYPEQILKDSNSTLYWVLTGEEGDYLTRLSPGGRRWSQPVQLRFPPAAGWTKANLTSGTSAIMVAGNELHLIVREGPRPEQNENDRYWHTMMVLNAPAIPLKPVPTITPTPTPTTEAVSPPEAMPSPVPTIAVQATSTANPGARSSPSLAIVIGILPAALLVIVVTGYQFRKQRHGG